MDKAFATQPRSLAGKLMGYDHAMFGFSPCRAYWRDVRKLASIVLDCEAGTSFIALRSGCRESTARSTHEGQMVAKFVDIGEIQTCDECSV